MGVKDRKKIKIIKKDTRTHDTDRSHWNKFSRKKDSKEKKKPNLSLRHFRKKPQTVPDTYTKQQRDAILGLQDKISTFT